MDMKVILDDLSNLLEFDLTIKSWAQMFYFRDPKVYVGLNGATPPPDTDYPLIWLYPIEKTGGSKEGGITRVIGISCRVNDDSTSSGSNLVIYNGVWRVDEFRAHAGPVVVNHFRAVGYRVLTMTTKYELVDAFPIFAATMTVTAVEDTEFGEDNFA